MSDSPIKKSLERMTSAPVLPYNADGSVNNKGSIDLGTYSKIHTNNFNINGSSFTSSTLNNLFGSSIATISSFSSNNRYTLPTQETDERVLMLQPELFNSSSGNQQNPVDVVSEIHSRNEQPRQYVTLYDGNGVDMYTYNTPFLLEQLYWNYDAVNVNPDVSNSPTSLDFYKLRTPSHTVSDDLFMSYDQISVAIQANEEAFQFPNRTIHIRIKVVIMRVGTCLFFLTGKLKNIKSVRFFTFMPDYDTNSLVGRGTHSGIHVTTQRKILTMRASTVNATILKSAGMTISNV